MRTGFVVMIGNCFLGVGEEGGIDVFTTIEEADKLNSYAEALFVAKHWAGDSWKIIEVAPDKSESPRLSS